NGFALVATFAMYVVIARLLLTGPAGFTVRQLEREILAGVVSTAHRDDDVLPAVDGVGHRRSALRRWDEDGADLFPRHLVVRAQHRAARMLRRRRHLRIAHDDQGFRHHQAYA